jgi:hypothetical protein
MFGKPEWFGRRKYSGWGLTPRTWQGWAYILVMVLPLMALPTLGLNGETIFAVTLAWVLLFCFDMLDIMLKLKKDEREKQIEALAERNSAWAMIAVIAAGVGYQVAQGIVKHTVTIDPFLISALLAGAAVKGVTNYYLERRM